MKLTDDQLKGVLLQANISTEEDLSAIAKYAASIHQSFSDLLIQKNIIAEDRLGKLIAAHLSVPFVELSQLTIEEDVFRLLPEKLSRRHKMVVFARDNEGIKVATSDPTNLTPLQFLAKKTNSKVTVYYATEHDIETTLQVYKKVLQKTIDELLKEDIQRATETATREAPIIKIVDTLIDSAYHDKASDIHIEPEEKESLIRFHIDGVLHDVLRMPKTLHDRIITRIKVLSRLRTDEHLSAQDGKMRIGLEEEQLDIRVSILPIADGEKAVLRLLSSRSRSFSLAELGMNERDLRIMSAAMSKSFGMILSTGPTGSGKTTTIYAMLKILNTREKNITTIEDPVEYRIQGANQIQVNTKTNLTFANGLRSILRQDPNIIFVGEIRDNETAGIAVNAALTGHLVLSTLHTNDAATAIPRLIDMKVEPFLVASTVNVVMAQRLVRNICAMCKEETSLRIAELAAHFSSEIITRVFGSADQITAYKGKGCKICRFTGYYGRLGVFEVLEVTNTIRELIVKRANSDAIAKAAISEGMTTMLEDGLAKVKQGLTTAEEVLRVTKVESL
jgi:type IV pilus assembly protein PilB